MSNFADAANTMTFDPESHVQDHMQSQKLAAIYLHDLIVGFAHARSAK